ncbi:MAG TPA: hypothetical protein VKD91_13360 [Pyrinomonadaceae bacterium]|nr:hypothetical protein [Pyrinomonadaceae bacterium]
MIHAPLYCAPEFSDFGVRCLIELHLVCLESYFAHQNTYDLLVTTNDPRPLEVLSAYKDKSRHRFELRMVNPGELLSTFHTDESRLQDSSCITTIFSKFYPILNQECAAIVHVDFDTMFMSKIDLSPLLVTDVGLVDANQFKSNGGLWCPTVEQARFFRIPQPARPVSRWINSGVFSVQRRGFDICRTEIVHYLENLELAIAEGLHTFTDEIIMNALAVRERSAVTVIPDYRYNFLAYYLDRDPSWKWRGQIVHFHSLKPYDFYFDGVVKHRGDAEQAKLINPEFYLAVLMWCRHLHNACRNLSYDFPMIAAMPLEVVENELARLRHWLNPGM